METAVHPAEASELSATGFAVPVALRPDRRMNQARRAHPRYQLTTTAEFTELESGARGSARSSDVSLGGCFVDTTSPYPAGKTVKLRLTRENRSFEAIAEIVCSMAGMGMGLKFIRIEPEKLKVLEAWIRELSGEAPPELESRHCEDVTPVQRTLKNEQCYVLDELIVLLMRKDLVPEAQGQGMLRRLHQAG